MFRDLLPPRLRTWLRAGSGRVALDWAAPAGRPHDDRGAPEGIDVVIPVYQAPEAFARCLAALLAHTDLSRNRALLVLDGPQPAATEALLEAPIPGVEILRNGERLGFVASVNAGMAKGPERDVVLLNSDAIVTAGWLEKLRAAAYSSPEIATVTPFSNTATICSLPRFLAANALPAGETIESFARRIEQRSARAYPRLPTGVGVCLFVKRRALAELGLFDQRAFGLGYGEESEWCQRALKAGWRHVLDDATFVYHEGHQSFGTTRVSRVRGAHRALAKLHPDYMATIARFVEEDPLTPIRERALAGLVPEGKSVRPTIGKRRPGKIVHLVHGWPPWSPAGTELYAAWLVRRQAAHREVSAYARIADPARALGDAVELLDGGARIRLMVNNFVQRDPRSRNALRDGTFERDFARFLDEERPDLLHVHHLAGHAATLPREVFRRGIPVLYQVQDWWTVCARANLLDARRRACSGPGLVKCSHCLPLTALPGAALLNPLLYAERGRLLRSALRTADARVAGSQFLADSLRTLLGEPDLPIEIIPYGVALADTPRPERAPDRTHGPPLLFGFLGSILPHKGLHVVARAFADLDPKRVRLEIYGDPEADPAYAEEVRRIGGAAIEWHGRFAEEDKAAVLGRLDALVVPSLGLESFGLAAREAMAAGTPVLAARRGALAELPLEAIDCGAFFDPEKPEELRAWIERLVATPEILDGWRSRLPAVTGMDEHAEAIEALYARVLARKGAA